MDEKLMLVCARDDMGRRVPGRRRRMWAAVLAAVVFSGVPISQAYCVQPAASKQTSKQQRQVQAWLAKRAQPLSTVDPDVSFEELRPIGESLGDARVVGVGESTHGTREFFLFKHRLWQYLVREQGFRVFAMESGVAESEAVATYIAGGPGSAADAVEQLGIGVWNTDEFVAMVEWMRSYNASVTPDRRIYFHGIDARSTSKELESISALAEQIDAPSLAPLLARAQKFKPQLAALVYRHASKAERAEFDATVRQIGELLGALDDGGDPASAVGRARNHFVALEQTIDQLKSYAEEQPLVTTFSYAHMAENAVATGTSLQAFLRVNDPTLPPRLERFLQDFIAAGENVRSAARASLALPEDDAHWDALGNALQAHVYLMQVKYRLAGAQDGEIDRARLLASDIALFTRTARELSQMSPARPDSRDKSMADNTLRLLQVYGPQSRVMLWAHNWHMTSKPVATGPGRVGTYLRAALGERYFAIGTAFDRGQFMAGDRTPGAPAGKPAAMTVGPAKPGSIDAMLASPGLPLFYIDLRGAPTSGAVAQWLGGSHPLRDVPASFLPSDEATYYVDTVPKEDYDALLFVEKTTGSRRR